MKKKYFWLAAMAVTVSMASCSLEEVVEQPAPQAIGFSSFVGKPTRGAVEIVSPSSSDSDTDTKKKLAKFYVFGKYGASTGTYDKEVYNNADVNLSDGYTNVGPTEVKYWIADKYYKFAAYSDGNSKIDGTESNPTVSFDNNGHITISNYSADTKDLILATPAEIANVTANYSTAVSLEFHHLLSQVAFEFENGFTNGYQVKITNLTFTVPNKATYSYNTSDYSWELVGSDQEQETNKKTHNVTVNSGNVFGNSASQLTEYNFVIPQSNSEIKASFTATVYDTDGTIEVDTQDFSNVSLATGTTTTPSSTNVWTAGYRYKYTAKITAEVMDDMKPIKFTVTAVSPWVDAQSDGSNSTFPLNPSSAQGN